MTATWPHSDSGLRQYCEDFSFHRIVALSRLRTLPGRATGSPSTGLFVSIRVVVLAEARTAEAPTGRWRSHCDSGPSAFCPAIPSGLRRAGQTGTWSRQRSPAGRRRSPDGLTSLANTREGGNPECPDGLGVCHTVIPWQGRRRRGVEPEEAPVDAGNRHIREGPCARLSAVLSKGGPHGRRNGARSRRSACLSCPLRNHVPEQLLIHGGTGARDHVPDTEEPER